MVIDDDVCFECGEPRDIWHHVVNKNNGGKKVIPLCNSCHSKIHGKNLEAAKDNPIRKAIHLAAIPYFLIEVSGISLLDAYELAKDGYRTVERFEHWLDNAQGFIRRGHYDELKKSIDEIYGDDSIRERERDEISQKCLAELAL